MGASAPQVSVIIFEKLVSTVSIENSRHIDSVVKDKGNASSLNEVRPGSPLLYMLGTSYQLVLCYLDGGSGSE